MSDIVIILIIVALLAISAFFSGTETGVYRLSRFRLRLGLQQRRKLYGLLDKLMADSHGLIFSILIGNNIANYLLTSFITYLFLVKTGSETSAELYSTLVTVPLLFVLGDLLPKNIFFYRADVIMPIVAPPAYVFHRILTVSQVVPVLKLIARLFSKVAGAPAATPQLASAAQRQHLVELVQETREEGVLSQVQAEIIDRLMKIPRIPLSAVMVPLAKVVMVGGGAGKAEVVEVLRNEGFRRVLVYGENRAQVVGFVDIYELLAGSGNFASLPEGAIEPIASAPINATVLETLNMMRNKHLDILLVTRRERGNSAAVGMVTIKDLLEELVGELQK
ncbi:MAG: hypothetical protein A2Y07_03535 [Planctomycetes bacterium GWF2_50_10]|nr:MAG: hypothetical protein A2Y07_03535 [Planctomycetes bacterium GWF2_50_10]